MDKRTGKGHRLVLMPSPLQGHITPLLQLADILYSRGFSITIIHTIFNSPHASAYPHFTFQAIPDCLSEPEASTSDPIHLTDLINIRCAHPLTECLATLLSQSQDPIACFIADAALHFTQPVCDAFHLPRLVLRTGGASSFVVFASFPLLREKGYLPIQESRLEEPVVELPPLKVKDLPRIETSDPEAFYKLVCRFVDECKASSGVIWNSFEELESSALAKLRQEFSIPIYPIGPFHKHFPAGSTSFTSLLTPDKSCISWLDRQEHNSVVYVSFGSIAAISETEFLEIAWGLANSHQPFLWVIRPGLIRGSEWLESLPSGFLENLGGSGYIVKWAPQEQVLSHPAVGAFWTHNGWNSTLESICEGVPMICAPRFADQKVNAKYVSDVWRVGVQLPNELERGEIEKTIRELMVGDEGNEIRENILHLKEKANLCLKEELLSESCEKPIACLNTDAMWHFSQAVADSLRIPRLVLRTTSACSFLAWDAFPLLREKGYLPQQESQLEESVAELPTLKVKDLPTINTQNSDNFYDLLLNMFKETKSSSGLILNTFQDLEQSALLILNSLRNRPISQILPCMQRPPLQVAY